MGNWSCKFRPGRQVKKASKIRLLTQLSEQPWVKILIMYSKYLPYHNHNDDNNNVWWV